MHGPLENKLSANSTDHVVQEPIKIAKKPKVSYEASRYLAILGMYKHMHVYTHNIYVHNIVFCLENWYLCVYVCVFVCVRVCVCGWVGACVRACVCVYLSPRSLITILT